MRWTSRLLSLVMSSMPSQAIKSDRYRCVTVSLEQLDAGSALLHDSEFEKWLIGAEKDWTQDQIRGVWFQIPLTHSSVVPVLAKTGYEHHHAKGQCLAMVKWLSKTESNNIPPYPFTNIGVGGLVIDRQDRVLVVQEKGEEIGETAEREVFEETGIRAQFQSILTIRHMHRYQFGCSDLYIVCLLSVDESAADALKLTRCTQEIADVRWMPLEQAMTCLSDFNRFVVSKYQLSKETGFSVSVDDVPFVLGGKLKVYSLQQSDQKSDKTSPSSAGASPQEESC